MWSPEGYINWGEFTWLCWRAAKLRWPTPIGYVRPMLENGNRDWENDNHFKTDATYRWLVYCALRGTYPVTSICSPQGQVLTASSGFFRIGNSGPSFEYPESFALLSDLPKVHVAFSQFIGDIGCQHLDMGSGQILHPRLWDLDKLRCIQVFHDVRGKANPNLELQIRNWHFARRFAGWAICFQKSEMFLSGDAFLHGITEIYSVADDPAPSSEDSLVASGLEHAFECFKRAFPHGKGGATWPEVEAKTGYSRRHIKRALDAYSGQDAGQGSGQDPI